MEQQYVITIVATDKPGIVQAVAHVVATHDGNWMDSSMVRLGGEFAGIVRISVPDTRADALRSDLAALEEEGMVVTVQDASGEPSIDGTTAQFSLSGIDHPGIVRDISASLAGSGVSIDELHTELFAASMTGEKMFSATAKVVIPRGVEIEAVRAGLETLASDIMVDIDIQTDD